MNSQKIIFILVGVVFVIGAVLVLVFGNETSPAVPAKTLDLPQRNDTVPEVSILHDYGMKIVYTTDTTINKDIYISDCSTRGGVFSVCGNTCAPTATTCTAVCALTCSVK